MRANPAPTTCTITKTSPVELLEVRLGGRNFIRPGDVVRVKPSRPGKRDGFVAEVRRIVETPGGGVEVDVIGAPQGRPAAFRTFFLERLARVAQSRREERS